MNKAVFAELRKAKDGNGNYYLAYGKGITSGFEWQLLGKPVYVSENMPEPTAAGNIPVLYGDFAGMAMKISQNLEIQLMREKYIELGAAQAIRAQCLRENLSLLHATSQVLFFIQRFLLVALTKNK